jgi:high-affinity Fe2+/Pb2+ permease
MIISIIISFTLSAIIAVLMVLGLTYMEKNHPDYKGEDLFDEDKDNLIK